MGTLAADVRYAVRSMLRRPLFTLTAVGTLALGIGANAAIFSVVNGLLIRPLPYPEAHELVVLYAENPELGWRETDVNAADAWDWGARSGVFEELAVYREAGLNLTGSDRPELLSAIRGTPNLLTTLGVEPVRGRNFTAGDARPGAPRVAILTDGFWERRFGSDAAVLGSTLLLDDEPTTVVGILPADFVFPDEVVDLYVPLREDLAAAPRGSHDRSALGRLLPGVPVERADRAVDAVARELQEEHPEQNDGWTAEVRGLREDILGDIARQASFVLMGAVTFVLLMACTNVGNLLLARAAARRTEMAVRTALGAGRGRILRQLLAESGLLAVAGGLVGTGLAWFGQRALVAGLPENMPPAFRFGLDGSVLAFTAAVSLGAALLFGLVPALRASGSAAGDLREGSRSVSADTRSRRFGSFLVVVQTALAVVLLVGAGVMVRSVAGMTRQDMGFEPDGVLTLRMSPPEARYEDDDALRRFWGGVLDRVRAVPGVEAAGAIQALPLGGSNWGGQVWIGEATDPASAPGASVRFGYVSPGYFRAMDVEVVAGRDLEDADVDGPPVVLVNQRFAERHSLDGHVLGTVLRSSGAREPVTVVGVVEDHIERGIDEPPEAALYFPLSQNPVRTRTLAIRTAGDPVGLVDAVQSAVWRVDPDQPVYEVLTMNEWVTRRAGGFGVIAWVMGVFGVISLLLGAVGIYGVTAYAVGRRTNEIGVRMAMGADRGRVVVMVLREGLVRIALGLTLGVSLAYLLSNSLAGLLVGVSPTDPLTFGTVVAVLLGVSLLGSWIPARRASGVDPVRALAAE